MKQPRDEAPAICTQEVERREVLGWGSVVGRNGRCVIDLRLPTGREGGRRRGRERRRWGGTARRPKRIRVEGVAVSEGGMVEGAARYQGW